MSKRDEYIEKLKAQLDDLNTKMDALEKKAGRLKEGTHESYEKQMDNLRALSKAAKEKISLLKVAGESQWTEAVNESEKVFKALHHSYNYFKSQLK